MGEWWMSHLHRISLVFKCHFKWLICLMVWAIPLFLVLCLVFLVWDFFVGFDLLSPKHVNQIKIRRPCRSRKVVKETQRHLTWTDCGQYHNLETSRKKQQMNQARTTLWVSTMVRGGPYVQAMVATDPLNLLVSSRLFMFQAFWMLAALIFTLKIRSYCLP